MVKPPTKKRKSKKQSTAPIVPEAVAKPRITIRHYCQGIGDCHLLTFHHPDEGGPPFRMLIDCGLHSIVSGGSDTIDRIATDIATVAGGAPIDVLVVTHEHWDHVSGFSTAKEIFAGIEFGEVWMPWTEKADDPLARKFDKYKGQALAALALAGARLSGRPGLSRHLAGVRDGLSSIEGFYFGAKGDKVRAARNAAASHAGPGKLPRYLEPASPPIEIEPLRLRIYVLGPPRDEKLLKLEERKQEMYQFGSRSGWMLERRLSAGLRMGEGEDAVLAAEAIPFDENLGHDLHEALAGTGNPDIARFILDHYSGPAAGSLPDQSWRRIDDDWLGMAADLAMQIDNGINNTSVVLAFEFTDTERVVLFPGDAQIGSWLSWQNVKWPAGGREVTGPNLLARTVYLKVSHHGSQNATPPRVGLEQMTSPDLSAFIPVNTDDAKKAGWHEMPFGTIMTELTRKTAGRVIRADDPWVKAGGQPAFAAPSGSILKVVNSGAGWVEIDVA